MTIRPNPLKALAAALLMSGALTAHAAVTDLATAPLTSNASTVVLPNVFFILDDSGSMDWDYMPDDASNFGTGTYGAASAQCNGVFYNPTLVYTPPVDSTGLSYANASFTAALDDGFGPLTGTKTNLSTSFQPFTNANNRKFTGTVEPAYYYKYTGSQTTEKLKDYNNTASTFYKECNSAVGSAPGLAVFTKVLVTALEQQNFANWWTYYHTRMLSMKTAAGLAFKPIGNTFRVGYSSINNNTTSDFLGLATFDATQKAAWYAKLYGAVPKNSTPLRTALSKVGQMYAMKLPGNKLNTVTVVDPIQYACQQNFAILTTDGYWRDPGNNDNPLDFYGLKLNNAIMDNQDGNDVRPMYDGAVQTKSTEQILQTQKVFEMTTHQVQQRTQQTQTSTRTLQSQTSQQTQDVGALQSQTSTLQTRTRDLQSSTSPLLFSTSTLLNSTANVLTDTYTLLSATATLQSRTNAVSSVASTLQGNVLKVLMRCKDTPAKCGTPPLNGLAGVGTGTATWSPAVQCTNGTGTKQPRCAVVTPIPALTQNVGTICNTAATMATASPWTTANTKNTDGGYVYSSCNYVDAPATPVASCTYTAKSATPNNTTVLNASVCSYAGWSAVAPTGACTYQSIATSTANGTQYLPGSECSYSGMSASTPTASCAYKNITTSTANGTPYQAAPLICSYSAPTQTSGTSCTYKNKTTATTDGTNWVSNPTLCSYDAYSPAVAGACTIKTKITATIDGTNYAPSTQCSYSAWSTPAAGACTISLKTASNVNNMVYNASPMDCTYGAATTPVNVGSCTTIAPTTSKANGTNYTPNPTQCTYSTASAWVGTPACTPAALPAGPTYNVTPVTECQSNVSAAFANAATCTPTTVPDISGNTTQCQYAWQTAQGTASCSAPAYVAGDFTNSTVYRNCATAITSPFANAASCNLNSVPNASGITTQCQYTPASAWSNVASCSVVSPSAGPNYTVGTARNCQVTDTGWVGVSICTPSTAVGNTVSCQHNDNGPYAVASCTVGTVAATAANSWMSSSCVNTALGTNVPVVGCTAGSSGAPNYVNTSCPTSIKTGPIDVSGCVAEAASMANNYITTTCAVKSGGTANTLADVAEYYYITDLRTIPLANDKSGAAGTVNGTDVSENIVPVSGLDKASYQHMTTFTLGLGARGVMIFDPSYQTATEGDFFAVKQGSTANGTTVCPWQTSGTCNWPVPGENKPENIDDLWHAAVNGRGSYFSAADPNGLSLGLSSALAGVSARLGSASAATTSTAFITPGDNFLFHSDYMSQEWTGNLVRYQIDPITGNTSTTPDWSAQVQLDAVALHTSRNIYFYKSTSANKLAPFLWANLSPAQQTSFSLGNLLSPNLVQFCASGSTCLSGADQLLASGANLVDYLRGDNTHQGALASNNKYYRARQHRLGDLVNSETLYVKKPSSNYTDLGYAAFKTSLSGRKGMTYVGANDGMLHAFDATTGAEDWAFIPSKVIPNLYKLADKAYSTNHSYFVDGSPVTRDVCVSGCGSGAAQWRTILVGGLAGGGAQYYALDVTDPANPQALWEFSHANLGYAYGNPVIAKQADGTWVVIVTSGYNNTAGDGQGHLFVLDAASGALLRDISTGVGSSAAPSGLSKIAVSEIAPGINAEVSAIYGGDLLGNMWRFDINDNVGPTGFEAQLLVSLVDAVGNPQPITSKPALGMSTAGLMVYIGTGRYLGSSDVTDLSQQSFYGFIDKRPSSSIANVAIYGDPRNPANTFVQQTLTNGTCPVGSPATVCLPGETVVKGTSNKYDLAVNAGWFFDFPNTGERNNTDSVITLGTVILT
ncbi:MAG: hypothetical protein HOO97_04805, partial [Sideroxydans sp.]|nr:hypothetical protein [Sideroxydans sp.]